MAQMAQLERGELAAVTLDDKYTLETGRVYLTGTQALVRLPMVQRQRDAAAGLNTGCFIAGYRGSPLGGLDQGLWGARRFIERNHIRFQPGINEEMAATAVWGSQQIGLFPGATYDGVFAMWYGKGPGVDSRGEGQLGLGVDRSRAYRDRSAGRFRDAAGRAQHPLARSAARPGIPAASLQDRRRARLRPRQPA